MKTFEWGHSSCDLYFSCEENAAAAAVGRLARTLTMCCAALSKSATGSAHIMGEWHDYKDKNDYFLSSSPLHLKRPNLLYDPPAPTATVHRDDPQHVCVVADVKKKCHPARETPGSKGLISCDGLTLAALHNRDHRRCSAASEPLPPQPRHHHDHHRRRHTHSSAHTHTHTSHLPLQSFCSHGFVTKQAAGTCRDVPRIDVTPSAETRWDGGGGGGEREHQGVRAVRAKSHVTHFHHSSAVVKSAGKRAGFVSGIFTGHGLPCRRATWNYTHRMRKVVQWQEQNPKVAATPSEATEPLPPGISSSFFPSKIKAPDQMSVPSVSVPIPILQMHYNNTDTSTTTTTTHNNNINNNEEEE